MVSPVGREMCETAQDELSDGCKCFQQLLLQRVHHTQSIPKQIKSKAADRMRKAAVDWMTITRTNEHPTLKSICENMLQYSWFYTTQGNLLTVCGSVAVRCFPLEPEGLYFKTDT